MKDRLPLIATVAAWCMLFAAGCVVGALALVLWMLVDGLTL
jgi:hypothetical protein